MSQALAGPTDPRTSAPPRSGAIVAVLAFAGIVTASMQTLVIPLVPRTPLAPGRLRSDATWAVTATLLAAVAAAPVVGRLGDMFGKRRMLLISLALLTVGSAIAALSTDLTRMIAGRALQGLSAGVIPLGISIMRDELPPERLGAATATMSSSMGVGGAIGLPAAALIADHGRPGMSAWTATDCGSWLVVAGGSGGRRSRRSAQPARSAASSGSCRGAASSTVAASAMGLRSAQPSGVKRALWVAWASISRARCNTARSAGVSG
ncbi:MAG TPA: MFS transporter [Nonomuraea sp.]|nr:MFS transporter [Nonomuraea sp.]